MASLDPTLAGPSMAGDMAERADAFRIAIALVRDAGLIAEASPGEILDIAQFIYGG